MLKEFIKLYINILSLFILIVAGLFFCLPESDFKYNIITELIGSGVVGSFISFTVLFLELTKEKNERDKEFNKFLNNTLAPELKEQINRGKSDFNLSGGKKAYFDGSYANSLYSCCEHNISKINEFEDLLSQDELGMQLVYLIREAKAGYVSGEKLDNLILRAVRDEHFKTNTDRTNDSYVMKYIKGKVFTNSTDAEILKYLDYGNNKIIPKLKKIMKVVESNPEFQRIKGEIIGQNKKLLKTESEIERILLVS